MIGPWHSAHHSSSILQQQLFSEREVLFCAGRPLGQPAFDDQAGRQTIHRVPPEVTLPALSHNDTFGLEARQALIHQMSGLAEPAMETVGELARPLRNLALGAIHV